MSVALDASCTPALALGEMGRAESTAFSGQLANEGAIVPPLWSFEVANGLLMALRRKRIGQDVLPAIMTDLERLPIKVDEVS